MWDHPTQTLNLCTTFFLQTSVVLYIVPVGAVNVLSGCFPSLLDCLYPSLSSGLPATIKHSCQKQPLKKGNSSAISFSVRSLEALDLSSNQFASVPTNLPRRLRKLTLRNNNIRHLPAFSFRHLRPGLRSLQLSHNHLSDSSADRASFVGSYRSLGELLLDNNHLEEVPPFIRQFQSLTMLRLDNNRIR